jgi:hypothetical protein
VLGYLTFFGSLVVAVFLIAGLKKVPLMYLGFIFAVFVLIVSAVLLIAFKAKELTVLGGPPLPSYRQLDSLNHLLRAKNVTPTEEQLQVETDPMKPSPIAITGPDMTAEPPEKG